MFYKMLDGSNTVFEVTFNAEQPSCCMWVNSIDPIWGWNFPSAKYNGGLWFVEE